MIPDPTEEIKAIRHRLCAEMQFDLRKIIADTRRRQLESGRTYIRLPSRQPEKILHFAEIAGHSLPDGGSDAATE